MRDIFKSRALNSYLPPPPPAEVPQPQGAWRLFVDDKGDPVTSRAPLPTDFLARAAAEYIDGGTKPDFKKDPQQTDVQNAQRLIEHQIRSQKNSAHLKKAVFLLSQTDDGLRLLQKSKQMGFTIVFDEDTCAEAKAVGMCDYSKKQIPLVEGRSAIEVALTLKHELQHMEDFEKGLAYNFSDVPKSAVLACRALEANARVSESVFAAEILMGSPRGPERQFKTATAFNAMWQKNPEVSEQAYKSLHHAKSNDWKSFAAAVFPAYFRATNTLSYYDEKYYRDLDKHVPDISYSLKAVKTESFQVSEQHRHFVEHVKRNATSLFTADRWTPERILSCLTVRGVPYVEQLKQSGFSMAGDAFIRLTQKAPELYAKIKHNIKVSLPETEKQDLLDLPVMTQGKLPPLLPNPYKSFSVGLNEEAFSAVVLPHRQDGRALANGQNTNAHMTAYFNAELSQMKSGATNVDRIHYTLAGYLHQNRGIANMRGLMSDVLEAGLRAPIAAFPEEYLFDLHGRIMLGIKSANPVRDMAVSPQELQLLDHWKQTKAAGLDALWGNDKVKNDSWLSKQGNDHHYADRILKLVEIPTLTARQPAQACQR